jgi:hypothetical protein
MREIEAKPRAHVTSAPEHSNDQAGAAEARDFQRVLQRRAAQFKLENQENQDKNNEPSPDGNSLPVPTFIPFSPLSHKEKNRSFEEDLSDSMAHTAALPVADRIVTRPVSQPSAINNGELSASLKEFMMTGASPDDAKIHVSFSDRLSPISEMTAQQSINGQIALRLTVQSNDVKRMETQLDQLRRRLIGTGLDVDDITLTADGNVRMPITRDPRSGA